jgi:S1-C subfamily serine protease
MSPRRRQLVSRTATFARYTGTFLAGLILGLLMGLSGCNRPIVARPPLPAQTVFQRLEKAAVMVMVTDGSTMGQGSGVVVGYHQAAPLVLTAAHLFHNDAARILVLVDDGATGGEGAPGLLIKIDRDKDLALIEVIKDDANLSTSGAPSGLPWRDALSIAKQPPGEFEAVYLMASPDSAPRTAGLGVLSALHRVMRGQEVYQITAFCWPGSSGGPVVNDRGELIGIIRAVARSGETIISDVCDTVSLPDIKRFVRSGGICL